jgi:hypothetical protein
MSILTRVLVLGGHAGGYEPGCDRHRADPDHQRRRGAAVPSRRARLPGPAHRPGASCRTDRTARLVCPLPSAYSSLS